MYSKKFFIENKQLLIIITSFIQSIFKYSFNISTYLAMKNFDKDEVDGNVISTFSI